jgi:hypothetical protein
MINTKRTLYELARDFKLEIEKGFISRLCSPRINWLGAYEKFLEQYGLKETDLHYEEFMKT